MSKIYYHFSSEANIKQIIEDGMLKGEFNFVCDSLEDITKFINFYAQLRSETSQVLVFTTEATFEESYDHDYNFFNGAKAFVSVEPVVIDEVLGVYDVIRKKSI